MPLYLQFWKKWIFHKKLKIPQIDTRQRKSLEIDRRSQKSSMNYSNFNKKALSQSEL